MQCAKKGIFSEIFAQLPYLTSIALLCCVSKSCPVRPFVNIFFCNRSYHVLAEPSLVTL